MYMNAYCYYLDSPPFSLDQTNTYTAINELQLFIDTYPNSDRVEECTNLMDRLREKLQKKAFNAANLYYKMRQYEAAITSYNTMLNDYPGTDYKEEILFNILKSYYYYGLKSIQSKQAERYQAALDAYNEFIFQYPDSKFLKDANAIRDEVQERIDSEQLTSKSK
jgi:outer membrane protein assembly factor BamD